MTKVQSTQRRLLDMFDSYIDDSFKSNISYIIRSAMMDEFISESIVTALRTKFINIIKEEF